MKTSKAERLILLLEMSVEQAFDILDIDPETYKQDELKDYYRKASIKHHPDKGGDVDRMKDVNLAYEKLKGTRVSTMPIPPSKEEGKKKVELVLRFFRNAFNPEIYKKYFEKMSGLKLEYTEEKRITSFDYRGNLLLKYEFFTPNRETVFKVSFNVTIGNIDFAHSLGAGDGEVCFDYFVDHYVYHARRQQKMKQRKWTAHSAVSAVVDPSKLFPKATLKKIFAGKKQRKFSKRDFIEGMKRELKAKAIQDELSIPLRDNLVLVMYRFSYRNLLPTWSFNGIYDNNKKIENLKPRSFFETDETLGFLVKLINRVKKKPNMVDVVKILEYEGKKYLDDLIEREKRGEKIG